MAEVKKVMKPEGDPNVYRLDEAAGKLIEAIEEYNKAVGTILHPSTKGMYDPDYLRAVAALRSRLQGIELDLREDLE